MERIHSNEIITGHPSEVIPILEGVLKNLRTHYRAIKVGITSDPRQRFSSYRQAKWTHMFVHYSTTSADYANAIEDHFILKYSWLKNKWTGYSKMNPNSDKYYLYFVVKRMVR